MEYSQSIYTQQIETFNFTDKDLESLIKNKIKTIDPSASIDFNWTSSTRPNLEMIVTTKSYPEGETPVRTQIEGFSTL